MMRGGAGGTNVFAFSQNKNKIIKIMVAYMFILFLDKKWSKPLVEL